MAVVAAVVLRRDPQVMAMVVTPALTEAVAVLRPPAMAATAAILAGVADPPKRAGLKVRAGRWEASVEEAVAEAVAEPILLARSVASEVAEAAGAETSRPQAAALPLVVRAATATMASMGEREVVGLLWAEPSLFALTTG